MSSHDALKLCGIKIKLSFKNGTGACAPGQWQVASFKVQSSLPALAVSAYCQPSIKHARRGLRAFHLLTSMLAVGMRFKLVDGQWLMDAQDSEAAADHRAGFKRLPSGVKYISGWPTDRKPVACLPEIQQSLTEAAKWPKIAFDEACQHAMGLDGSPLLLDSRCLHCSSNFTGLLA